jgi:hypothetical protein
MNWFETTSRNLPPMCDVTVDCVCFPEKEGGEMIGFLSTQVDH